MSRRVYKAEISRLASEKRGLQERLDVKLQSSQIDIEKK
jgi:hypothetical protein